MRRAALAVSVLASGCLPDLGPWYVELPPAPADGGATQRDAGRPHGGPCALPHLLVSAENLDGGPGAILRYELPAEGGVRACAPLDARGALMPLPFSVAAATEEFVLVSGREGVQAINPATDQLLYALPRWNQHPNDAFVLYDAARGDWLAGVAWSNLGSSASLRGSIVAVVAYAADGVERRQWSGSSLGIGTSIALTTAPNDASKLLAMNPSSFAAAVLDPFASVLETSPPLVPPIESTWRSSIGAGTGGGTTMIAWTGRSDGESRVFTLEAPYGGSVVQATCADVPCDFQHVAVDPSRPRAIVALCGRTGLERDVVRLDFALGVCETLVPSAAVPSGLRLSYLAFAQSR
ncbi:MAG TPA: hypothetical protein VIL20_22655 [Sandaracinaceae bacterium]